MATKKNAKSKPGSAKSKKSGKTNLQASVKTQPVAAKKVAKTAKPASKDSSTSKSRPKGSVSFFEAVMV